MKVKPRRSNWAGLRSSVHRVTRQFSTYPKVSRPLTFVRSTAFWSLEAWTGWYACGTHIFLGEEPEFSGLYSRQLTINPKASPLGLVFRFRKPNGILKGHSAPITYLHIIPENGQIFSVSIDCTVKVIYDSFVYFCDFPHSKWSNGVQHSFEGVQ